MPSASLVIDGCSIATVDDRGSEYRRGHIVVESGRITAIGEGPAAGADRDEVVDATGTLATPGLVNCHHHLYQWLTRGQAQEATLFEWLTALYPRWALIDERLVNSAARAALTTLALSGCTTSTDHHYVFRTGAGDLLAAEIDAAREVGLRFHPCRGSMDLGVSQGGLPPDEVVEDTDAILDATSEAVDRYHDPAPDSMLQIAVAPCSPFSVTKELMSEAADLARSKSVRLHTHLAETMEEETDCIERYGMRPVDFLDSLGWLGNDVWLAHCVHLNDDEIARFGATGTGVAHCPSSNGRLGAGMAPVAGLVAAGAPVGLGVDGAASNESGELTFEMRLALLSARARGGPAALSSRDALALATIHGARCLGRDAHIGSLEVGKLADIALWRLDDLGHVGIQDPVAALVLGPLRPVDTLFVAGRKVVADAVPTTVNVTDVERDVSSACKELEARFR
jgi:cytosine/adenosine deaminase-related metal-dependent hydrolase